MASARLQYPYALEGLARGEYSSWLRQHLPQAAAYFLQQEETEALQWLAEDFAETREEVELLVQAANSRGDAGALSRLLHVLHSRFPGKKKRFAL